MKVKTLQKIGIGIGIIVIVILAVLTILEIF